MFKAGLWHVWIILRQIWAYCKTGQIRRWLESAHFPHVWRCSMSTCTLPASILYKSIADRYQPVSYPYEPITARYRFIKNAYCVRTRATSENSHQPLHPYNLASLHLSPEEVLNTELSIKMSADQTVRMHKLISVFLGSTYHNFLTFRIAESSWIITFEPAPDKTYKRSVWLAKPQISLYIYPVWQRFSFIPLWIARRL